MERSDTPQLRPTFTLGERMRKARKNAGLTLDEMGKQLEYSRSLISRWENDLETPRRYLVPVWAHLCSVDIHWLAGDDLDLTGWPNVVGAEEGKS